LVVVVVLGRPFDVELSCALQAVRADTHELREGITELGEPHCIAASEVADSTERRIILDTVVGVVAAASTDAVAGVRVDQECNVCVEHEPVTVQPHLQTDQKGKTKRRERGARGESK
jgi:hypothetical protein